jgi:PAS domain S-box-containing protein
LTTRDFSRQLEDFRSRVAAVHACADELLTQPSPLLEEALGALDASSERLQETEAELRTQNEELRATQQKVEAERWRYQELFAFAPDAYLVTDMDGMIEEANLAASRLLRAARESLIGQPIVSFIALRDRRSFRLALNRLPQMDPVPEWSMRLNPRGGGGVEVTVMLSAGRDAAGRIRRLRWLIRDTTDRHRAAATERLLDRLRTEKALLEAVLSTAPIGLAFFDRGLRFVRLNTPMADMNGVPRHAHLGRTVQEILPGLAPTLEPVFRQVFDSHEPMLDVLVTGQTPASPGEERHWRVSLIPVSGPDGEVIQVGAVTVEVTEQKRAEARLEERVNERTAVAEEHARELARSNSELEQFAYVVSHDLQEPLRMVVNFTELLARRYEGRLGRDADDYIGFTRESVERMHTMITDLLTVARVGRRDQSLEPIDLNERCQMAIQYLMPAILESEAEISVGPLPSLVADGGQMLQLFQNLIGNAIKFRGAQAPVIRIRADREPGLERANGQAHPERVRISVTDNGIGIAPEYANKIFGVFQRLHGRAEYPGNGIGLAICKKIVERHGGEISVDSTPGGGSTFRFTLAAD